MTELEQPVAEAVFEEPDEPGRIGIFPSWRWLYLSVIGYTAVLTVVLYVLTVTLDHSAT